MSCPSETRRNAAWLLVSSRSAPAASAAVIADSVADWSTTGTQGEDGWRNGYYNYTTDANHAYQTGDFIQFDSQYWTGTQWDLLADRRGPGRSSARRRPTPTGRTARRATSTGRSAAG